MNVRPTISAAFLALIAGAVSGCSDSTGGDGGERVTIASIMGQDTQFDETAYQEQEQRIQELIAQCMTEQGWEYIPVQYPDSFYEYSEEDELERRQREGFGMSYWILNQGEDVAYTDPFQEWVDPNQAIVENFTEAETTAYYEALYGTQEENDAMVTIEIDPVTGEEMQVMTGYGAGCSGEAYTEVYGNDPTQSEEYWQAISVFYEEMYERVEADPRVKELDRAWSACMKSKGYDDYVSPNEFWDKGYMSLQTRLDEIIGPDFYADPFAGWTESEINAFFENSTEEEINDFINPVRELTEDQRLALEALLADEIALSVAEFECSKPYQSEYQAIYEDIEERYALEHRAELEALALSLGIG